MLGALALAYITVQPGNTLSGIAASHGVSLAAVEGANPGIANPNLIYAGESVAIPSGGSYTSWSPGSSHSSPVTSRGTSSTTATNTTTANSGDHEPDGDGDDPVTYHSTPVYHHHSHHYSSYSSSSSGSSSSGTSSSGGGYSGGGLSSVPGVPSGFASCVAFHESTNGTNAAYNGGVYGIIRASGVNVNGQSVSAQKAAFSQLYQKYGTSPWRGDGCA